MPPPPAMPAWIPSRLYRMTVEQYEAMAASGAIPASHRVHLINGYLVEKMTHNPPHTVADIRCGKELDRVIPRGWHVRPGKPIRIPGRDSEPEPDRCVVRGTMDDYDERHPGPEDIVLIVEIADSSLAEDRDYAIEPLRARGHPGLLDRQRERPPGRGLHPGGPARIRAAQFFGEGKSVPVMIRGRQVGRIAVKDILPPRRRRAKAEGNGA